MLVKKTTLHWGIQIRLKIQIIFCQGHQQKMTLQCFQEKVETKIAETIEIIQ